MIKEAIKAEDKEYAKGVLVSIKESLKDFFTQKEFL